MFKLLGNIYYSPTATEVAIGLRSSKLFLPKYHILNSDSICRLIIFFVVITSLLSRVQRYIFIFNCQTFIRTICIFFLCLYSRQLQISYLAFLSIGICLEYCCFSSIVCFLWCKISFTFEATSKNSTFLINKRVFFETFACFDFVDVAIARNS